jgi:type IV pilus assembly protein PilP
MGALKKLLLCSTLLLLASCGGGMDDLVSKVAEVKARKAGRIDPLPQIKQYEAFAYDPGNRPDPFSLPEAQDVAATSGPRPDMDRPKEPLEEFPLDSLRMQGIIQTPSSIYALVLAPDGVLHRVTVGDHLGQNYGQIKAIAESEISLAELVPDGFGGWVTRPATLALAE